MDPIPYPLSWTKYRMVLARLEKKITPIIKSILWVIINKRE